MQLYIFVRGFRRGYKRKGLYPRAAWLAQLGEHQSAEREVVSSNPGGTINQGL